MGEEQKPEEPKAEEAKPVEKKEEKAEEKPPAEEEKAEPNPKPPSPFILSVDLHCVGCAKKIEKSLLRIRGVVGVDTDMVKNQVTIKGMVEPQAVCNKIMKKTKRSAKVLSPVPAAEGEPIPEVVASQVPGLTTIELNVTMHCEACAQQLRRKILKMKGVSTVETELSSGKVTVIGTMDGEKLVEYVYRRTRKQAKIVPQPEPEPEPQPEKPKEGAKPEEKEEEKAGEEAKQEEEGGGEKPPEEEKKEGGGDEKKEEEEETKKDGGGGDMNVCDEQNMQRMRYYYQYQPLYVMERIPAPQLFSDVNPNACSIC